MNDPLYLPLTELPGVDQPMRFAGLPVEVGVTDTPPEVIDAQWMDDREVQLTVTDDLSPDDFAQVLPEFERHAATLADRPTTAAFGLPSRDVVRSRVAREAGFLPASVLAVADLRRGEPRPSEVTVRDAVPADAGVLAALWSEQADYEASIGTLRTSDLIRAAITDKAAAVINGAATVLVAETDGTVCGAVIADTPDDSARAATRLTASPSSYVVMAGTAAAMRSRGVGAGLVAELHRRQRAAGIVVSTLHYSAFNPLSVPFWSQQGYRPLVTIFARKVPLPT